MLQHRAEAEADARQATSEKMEALNALIAKAGADLGLAVGPATGGVQTAVIGMTRDMCPAPCAEQQAEPGENSCGYVAAVADPCKT